VCEVTIESQARFPRDGVLHVEGLHAQVRLADVVASQLLLESAVDGAGSSQDGVVPGLCAPQRGGRLPHPGVELVGGQRGCIRYEPGGPFVHVGQNAQAPVNLIAGHVFARHLIQVDLFGKLRIQGSA
jgi:hypothetical protein